MGGFEIWRSVAPILLSILPLAGFVLGSPEFKSSHQVGFVTSLFSFSNTVEAPVSGHPQEVDKVSATDRNWSWPLTGMCKYRVCMR